MSSPLANFYDFPREELRRLVARWDLSPVHAARLWRYVYLEGVTAWSKMPELPARFRAKAETALILARLPVATETRSTAGCTRKYLLALAADPRTPTAPIPYTAPVTPCRRSRAGCPRG